MNQQQQLVCVTNYMPDVRSCSVKDDHYGDCRDDTCTGCTPRQARVGLVCNGCYGRVEDALLAWPRMQTMLAGVDRAITSNGGGRRGQPGVPIPPVPLAFEEIASYHRSYRGTAERWVASEQGAADAIRFARAVRAAEIAHPVEEKPRKMRVVRCQKCNRLTLVWNAPTYYGGDVIVRCADPLCGWEADRDSFETIAGIEERHGHRSAA